ncbi:hypothetical protein RHMOL_Rhmol05G0107300 [Rhododendron molle]|uniref:Uncharacterized protein n=1 Tax=Rhododendron molle TaxID=49168 RepID=A0ACC0NNM5_RHOML|nr:hypothetical protein RHMOL_Rhmol05G0107300 [Rhododendron molle]
MSTLIQFRTHCLSPPLQFKKRSLLPPPLPSFLSHPCSDFSLPKLRGKRILHSNGVLARAEDKARNSSSPSSPSSSQQTQATDSEKKIQGFDETCEDAWVL